MAVAHCVSPPSPATSLRCAHSENLETVESSAGGGGKQKDERKSNFGGKGVAPMDSSGAVVSTYRDTGTKRYTRYKGFNYPCTVSRPRVAGDAYLLQFRLSIRHPQMEGARILAQGRHPEWGNRLSSNGTWARLHAPWKENIATELGRISET